MASCCNLRSDVTLSFQCLTLRPLSPHVRRRSASFEAPPPEYRSSPPHHRRSLARVNERMSLSPESYQLRKLRRIKDSRPCDVPKPRNNGTLPLGALMVVRYKRGHTCTIEVHLSARKRVHVPIRVF